MNQANYKTDYLEDQVSSCESVEELKERILPMLQSQKEQWKCKFHEIMEKSPYTKTEFARLCHVSRMTVNSWESGTIPKSREQFIRIGLVADYDEEQMNQLLQRYGRYRGLYSKSLEDCVCIFVLGHDLGVRSIDAYDDILGRIKGKILKSDQEKPEDISTEEFDEKLSEVHDMDELDRFVEENTSIFQTAYHRFYAYVKVSIENNYPEYASNTYEYSLIQGWSSSLRQCVSAIRKQKWNPTRNKIISLGLHFSMLHTEIDEILQLAHMEPLCSKNIFESVIIFILEDAEKNNMLDKESEEFDPDQLCIYARKIFEELDIPELEFFISELPQEDEDE